MSNIENHVSVGGTNIDTQEEYILSNYERDFPLEANRTCKLSLCLGRTMLIARLEDGYIVAYNMRNSSLSTIFAARPVTDFNDNDSIDEKEWLAHFSFMLNEVIHRSNLSISEIAKRSGLSRESVYGYCKGTRIPSAYIVSKLAAVLACDVEELTELMV